MDRIAVQLLKYSAGSKERTFFENVLEKLGPSFVRRSVEKELKESHRELKKCMKENFESQIIMNAAIQSMELSKISSTENQSASNQTDNEVVDALVHPLDLNCVKKYLPSDTHSQEMNHLGLSQEFVSTVVKSRQMSKSEQANFIKQVENNLNEFCEKLMKYTGHNVLPHQNWKDSFNEVIIDLELKAKLLNCEEMEGQPKPQQIQEQFALYYKELSKGISIIDKLISLCEKKLSFESDVAQCYCARSKSLVMKMRVLECKVREATYTKDTIPALQEISKQLDLKKEKLEEELKEKRMVLADYERLGTEFNAFVEEYTNLKKSIKQEKWAIEEIKRNNS